MSDTTIFLFSVCVAFVTARIGLVAVPGGKGWKRASEIAAAIFLAAGVISFCWPEKKPEKNERPPVVRSTTGSVSSNVALFPGGATGPINSAPPAAPLPAPPIQLVGFQFKPFVKGALPAVEMYLRNTGTSSVRVALNYEVFTVDGPRLIRTMSDYHERGELEGNLWSRFVADMIPTIAFMDVPGSQRVWISMRGREKVEPSETPATTRFYFLSRVFGVNGKKLFDSCVFMVPNTATHYQYCIDHNN